MDNNKSYKTIVKTTGLIDAVQVFQIVFGLIRNKVLAILVGTHGVGIWGLYKNFTDMAAKTKPFGFQAFYPGPGIGGHCIPLDPFYLEHIAKKYNFDLSMIHAAGHINMRMPHCMYIKIATALNRHKKAVNGSNILFLGVAYKPNIDDERESPALDIIDTVIQKGGIVSYNDPHIPKVRTNGGNILNSADLSAEALAKADCVVLTTNHDAFDVEFIKKHAKMIVDMRNMIKEASNTVYKL